MSSNHHTEQHDARMNSPSASSSVAVHENTKSWFIAVIMAVSIILNIFLIYAYRDFRTQEWLKDNNLQFFETNQFAALQLQVAKQDAAITALTIRRACSRE